MDGHRAIAADFSAVAPDFCAAIAADYRAVTPDFCAVIPADYRAVTPDFYTAIPAFHTVIPALLPPVIPAKAGIQRVAPPSGRPRAPNLSAPQPRRRRRDCTAARRR